MKQYIDFAGRNERLIFIVLPILMTIIFAFFPIVDILGKASVNGVKLVFSGKGFGIGRLFATVALLLPIAALVVQFLAVRLPDKIASRFNIVWTGASLLFVVLMAISLPSGVSLAWGAYIYCLLAVTGIAVDLMLKR